MIILGITLSHESGVSLIEDGQVVAAVNEERFSRIKCDASVPVRSLQWVFSKTGYRPIEVTAIAIGGLLNRTTPPVSIDCVDNGNARGNMKLAELLSRNKLGSALMSSQRMVKAYQRFSQLLPQKRLFELKELLLEMDLGAPVFFCDHHTAHMASAYFTSGWKEALVISNDGFGDGFCSKIAIGQESVLREIEANPFLNSLGMYYLYITHLCGFPKYYHAGKTMGLAALGNAKKTIKYFEESLCFNEQQGRYENHGLVFRKEIERMRSAFNGTPREDLAAGIQCHLENILEKQVQHYIKKIGCRNIALAGGIHANVRGNQKIGQIPGVEGVYIHPNMGDGGLGTGAALWLWSKLIKEKGGEPIPQRLHHVYLGPHFDDKEIESILKEYQIPFNRPSNLAQEIAKALSSGKIVARFDGKMEYGPRALGNRSILYQATDRSVNTWLNSQLQRTEFMPFAPVIRNVDAPDFLKVYDQRTSFAARFMTITYDVTERCKKEAPAVVHVDGTARPQVIHEEDNPSYYEILGEYKKLSGLSVLVNTSFNMHEEPIVCSPREAIQAFQRSGLDVLVLNSFLIAKN